MLLKVHEDELGVVCGGSGGVVVFKNGLRVQMLLDISSI